MALEAVEIEGTCGKREGSIPSWLASAADCGWCQRRWLALVADCCGWYRRWLLASEVDCGGSAVPDLAGRWKACMDHLNNDSERDEGD